MNSDELNITSIQIYVYMVSNIPLQKGLNIHKNAFFNNICNSHRIKKNMESEMILGFKNNVWKKLNHTARNIPYISDKPHNPRMKSILSCCKNWETRFNLQYSGARSSQYYQLLLSSLFIQNHAAKMVFLSLRESKIYQYFLFSWQHVIIKGYKTILSLYNHVSEHTTACSEKRTRHRTIM